MKNGKMAKNYEKFTHKTRRNIPTIKYFFFLILILTPILCINLVSAFDWINETDGFSTIAFGSDLPVGIWGNGTDFWIIDYVDKWIYHTLEDGTNLTDGSSISTTGARGLVGNGTDFWYYDADDKKIYHILKNGTQLDNFSVSTTDINAFGGFWKNNTDFRFTDSTHNWVYHTSGDGTNISDGFSTNVIGSDDPRGIWSNETDFWIFDTTDDWIYHTLKDGTNITDGFSMGDFGATDSNHFWGDGSNFWLADYIDNWIYHIALNTSIYTFTLTSPADDATIYTTSTNFTVSYLLFGAEPFNLTNATYYVWDSTGAIFNNSVIVDITGTSNTTNENIGGFTIGDYEWNVLGCYKNSTFSTCTFASSNFSFSVGSRINNYTSNSTTYETARESFRLNITNSFATPTNAKINYNGTEYTATITHITGNNYTIDRNISAIPLGIGNKTFYFTWNSGIYAEKSGNYSQVVNQTLFGFCNTTLNIPYINISFKDEELDTAMKAEIDASTWYYWLGDGSINKTLTFSNQTDNLNYAFCFSPNFKSVNLDISVQYSNESYPQRKWENTSIFTNTTTNVSLFLLGSAEGVYVTFQVLNTAEQSLAGVNVVAQRTISGTTEFVGEGITGTDGGVTFWLNPDYSHTFTFTKDGYDTYTTTLTPTQATYTIIMGTTTTTETYDFSQGVFPSIRPLYSDVLSNNTVYNFNLTITSSYWDLDGWGFTLTNGTVVIGSNSSTTGTGGILSLVANTGTNETIIMNYYWLIDGNYSNGTVSWNIGDTTDYGFSILTFFKDVRRYTSEEIFGLNPFSRTLIIFLIIFLLTAGISYTSGIYSPVSITWMIVMLVALFDIALGMIAYPASVPEIGPITFPLATIISILLAGSFTLREYVT